MTVQGYILVVQRHPHQAGLPPALLEALSGEAGHSVRKVATLADALEALDTDAACAAVVLDIGEQDTAALKAVTALAGHAADAPVVVVLDDGNETTVLPVILAGAHDYLVRSQLDAGLLGRALHYARQRRQVESALVERSLRDPLTGLPRRRLLLDRLGVAMKRCARDGSSGTLLFIDLDQFKQVNQLHGRAAGDAVLRSVGQRVTALVRDSDTVARFGGDEFAVLLPNESGLLEALAVGEKLIEALGKVFVVEGKDVEIKASVGVARFRDATEAPELVVQRAEQAMCTARAQGKEGGRARVRML